MNWFLNFLSTNKVKELQEENENLKTELKECSEKLVEKQEHINKTNAYWKRKMHTKSKKQKDL